MQREREQKNEQREYSIIGFYRPVNRIGSSKSEKELKQRRSGSTDAKLEVIAIRWYDNKTVDTMSTYIGLDPIGKTERSDKKKKEKITIDRPAITSEYKKFMGGVYLLESLTALYKFPINSRRWYMYIFFITPWPSP